MKNSIKHYLNWIPLCSDELYQKIYSYTMSNEDQQMHGYPLPDKENPTLTSISFDTGFSDSNNDPAAQKCRCGKTVSILEENWFLDEAGCTYHPGKRIFDDGLSKTIFNCCGKPEDSSGCCHGKHHVSFHRPHLNINFWQTEQKQVFGSKKPSNIFALDCEMVFTTCGLELAKVTLIDIGGYIVYDSYVQPKHEILDYNFKFSGIDESKLKGVKTTVGDVQKQFSELLNQDSILIGHCLENDFLALNMIHERVVDTACLFPHKLGHPYKHSLKHLAYNYLQKKIQNGDKGHNSIEDAQSCMELVLLKVFDETCNALLTSPLTNHFNNISLIPAPHPMPNQIFSSEVQRVCGSWLFKNPPPFVPIVIGTYPARSPDFPSCICSPPPMNYTLPVCSLPNLNVPPPQCVRPTVTPASTSSHPPSNVPRLPPPRVPPPITYFTSFNYNPNASFSSNFIHAPFRPPVLPSSPRPGIFTITGTIQFWPLNPA